jgi:hypothetical protein
MRAASLWGGVFVAAMGLVTLALPSAVLAQGDGPVTCGSVNGRYARCPVGWRDAQLIHQDSDTRCERGRNWGFERGAIWVDRGCRGRFVAAGRERHHWRDRDDDEGGWRPGPDWDRDIQLQCGSVDNRYRFCQVDLGRRGRVRLLRQESDAACSEGYSWGYNRAGIWVDHGCRAQFLARRRR